MSLSAEVRPTKGTLCNTRVEKALAQPALPDHPGSAETTTFPASSQT
jgi:hypothetical protein